jgi:hypothetical protein
MVSTLGIALIAGIVSVLSPCVVPLPPIVLDTAVAQHRLAPAALAFGVALSFTAVGIFVATIGFALGIAGGVFRSADAHPATRLALIAPWRSGPQAPRLVGVSALLAQALPLRVRSLRRPSTSAIRSPWEYERAYGNSLTAVPFCRQRPTRMPRETKNYANSAVGA